MTTENPPVRRRRVLKTIGASVIAGGTIAGVATAQTTRTVPDDYSTIQAAIDAADPGDQILIDNGTYAESLQIHTAGLTIRGETRNGVVIDASGESGRGIDTDAPDLTLASFTLIGTADAGAGYGIKVNPGGDAVTIAGVTVQDSQRTGIDLHGISDGTVEDVFVEGTTSGNGIALTDCHAVEISEAGTTGNAWGGLALYTSGTFVDPGLSDVTVQNSTFSDEPAGLYAQDSGGTGPGGFANITVTGNEFTNDAIGVLNRGGDLAVENSAFEIPAAVRDEWFHVYFTDGAQGSVVGNTMSGAHRVGILLDGVGTDAQVHANKVAGTGPKQSGWAENGIQVSRGATAAVTNNTVESNWWEGADWSSSGILVVDTEDVAVRRNTVRGNEVAIGIASFFESTPTAHNLVERNTVIGGAYGVALQAVGSFGPADATVQNNVVSNNTLNSRDGLVGISESEFGADATADDNDYVRNRIHGYDTAFAGVDAEDREDSVITPVGPPGDD